MSYNVIGNGESSKNFDLYNPFLGQDVGTKAYRDFISIIQFCDPRMVSEAVNNNYSIIHTQ